MNIRDKMKLTENYKKISSVFYDTVYPEIQHGGEASDRSINKWWKYLDSYFSKMFKSQWVALKKQKTSGGRDKTYDIIEDYFVEDALMDPDTYANEKKGEQIFKKNLNRLTRDMKSNKFQTENVMKRLTKSKLKEIIREELLKEGMGIKVKTKKEFRKAMATLTDDILNRKKPKEIYSGITGVFLVHHKNKEMVIDYKFINDDLE